MANCYFGSSATISESVATAHQDGDAVGGPGGFNEDGEVGSAGDDNKIGENSGGMKFAHTSYSDPNWRRNRSENPWSVTGIGNRMTVPTYGMAAMQQVTHAAKQLIKLAANEITRRNSK
jgi:hypothetical protein